MAVELTVCYSFARIFLDIGQVLKCCESEMEKHLEKFCEWSTDFDAPLHIDTEKLEIPDDIMTCEKDGINWIACATARKFKELDPSLGSQMKDVDDTTDYKISKFANLMNRGSLYYPTKKWYNQVVKMYFFVFNHFHSAVLFCC